LPYHQVSSNVSLQQIRKTPSFNLQSTTVTSDSSKQLQLHGLWPKPVKLHWDSKICPHGSLQKEAESSHHPTTISLMW